MRFALQKAKPYTKAQRRQILKESGPICPFCSVEFIMINGYGIAKPNNLILDVHHIIPRGNLGKSTLENGIPACNKYCHHDIHDFIDMFRVESNADFKFLTTVYVWFFAKSPTKQTKSRFHYYVYANNLKNLADMFWEYLVTCSKETQALFFLYYRTKSHSYYTELIQKHTFGFDHTYVHLVLAGLKALDEKSRMYFGRYNKYVQHLDTVAA